MKRKHEVDPITFPGIKNYNEHHNYIFTNLQIKELGNGYGLQLDYQIPIEATDRELGSRFKSWGSTKLYRVMYPDNLCERFTSIDAFRRALKVIENEVKRYGLILSRPKTESMTLNHDEETTKSERLNISR